VDEKLRTAKALLFDLDGTIYRGESLLPGAYALLNLAERRGKQVLFLTNNSKDSPATYREKLGRMGLHYPCDAFISAGSAACYRMNKERPGARLSVLGTPAFQRQLSEAGFLLDDEKPEALLLGLDTTLTFEKLRRFCNHVADGLPYAATHGDKRYFVEDGLMPDAGALIEYVRTAAGRGPDWIAGKPHDTMLAMAEERTGLSRRDMVMVGDSLATDIAFGRQNGVYTVLVLTGLTDRKTLERSEIRPDAVAEGIGDLLAML